MAKKGEVCEKKLSRARAYIDTQAHTHARKKRPATEYGGDARGSYNICGRSASAAACNLDQKMKTDGVRKTSVLNQLGNCLL